MSNSTPQPRAANKLPPRSKRRTITFTLFGFLALIILETNVHSLQRFGVAEVSHDTLQKNTPKQPHDAALPRVQRNKRRPYHISNSVKQEYKQWHSVVRTLSQMDRFLTNWTLPVNWTNHPTKRSDRFPSVQERVQYYMGKWYNASIPMYGPEFDRDTYIQRQSTLQYETFAGILIHLYNLDKGQLLKCYQNKKELKVFSPYCRDYIDIAILNGKVANVIHYIGDELPLFVPEELVKYPMFAKVRALCDNAGSGYTNGLCEKREREKMEPIILPLNRKRHFGVATEVPNNDITWEQKEPKAVWRGKYEKVDMVQIENGAITRSSDIKYALVSKHLNSSLVDAKFSTHNTDAPSSMTASYMDMKEQLQYRYIISIEGNDVSSGLKWMLLSNSVVLAPPFTWESWAMEATLKPFVHYLPIKEDMSNVEEMIHWAEDHLDQTRLIAERSTLFIYDLLFHPDAIRDEQRIMERMMEVYENNFGIGTLEFTNTFMSSQLGNDATRNQRFPTVEDRVAYYMGKWYGNASISMAREDFKQLNSTLLATDVTTDSPFIASGDALSQCAHLNSSCSDHLRRLCRDALPHFDERSTADLKSASFKRLLKTKQKGELKLSPRSSWIADTTLGNKEPKRVLLDDSVKIINYGVSRQNESSMPIFSRRREVVGHHISILWPFGIHNTASMLREISAIDTDFDSKHAKATFRSGFRADRSYSDLTHHAYEDITPSSDIRNMLMYRYLVATKDEGCSSDDLMWMLYSKSVLLMPVPQCESWLMEGELQPRVHYLPVFSDLSNIEDIVKWAEENPEQTRVISERSTQYIYDLFLHPDAIRDEKRAMENIMEKYKQYFG